VPSRSEVAGQLMRFNKLIPELEVTDLKKSLDFYNNLLGFKIEYVREESKFAFLSFNGSQIMIQERVGVNKWDTGKLEHPFGRGINFQIECKDVESLAKNLEKNNYKLFVQIQENWYRQGKKLLGNKEFLVQDPDGYLLRFSQDIGWKPLSLKL